MTTRILLLVACSTLSAALPTRNVNRCGVRSCAIQTRGGYVIRRPAEHALEKCPVETKTITWDGDAAPIKSVGSAYTVPNLLFVGMNTGGIGATIVGLLALAIKLVLAGSFVKSFLVDAVPLTDYTWSAVSEMAAGQKWGLYAAMAAAPAFLLKAMADSSEFKDQAVYWATLRSKRGSMSSVSYVFWLLVHALRSYVLLPLFVLANASVMATTPSFEKVLQDAFYAALILSTDDCIKMLYEKMTGTELKSTVRLGAETKKICDGVERQKIRILTVAQLVLVGLLKTAAFGSDARLLYALPILTGALGGTYLSHSLNFGHAALIAATILVSSVAIVTKAV